MNLKDLVKYRGYMPVRMEREDTLKWMGELIGGDWLDKLWLGKYGGYHEVRYRMGDVQEAQFYMKDKTWKGIPIGMWQKFTEMDRNALDDECWQWIQEERKTCGVSHTKTKAVVHGSSGILDL